jgi:pimeloyl-ACP methyl ester carboxylesterase
MMTAVRRPDLFRALALIDPVLLPLRQMLPLRVLPRRWAKRVPIIRKALGRPDRWQTQQQAFDFHRRARAFARLEDGALWDYIRAGTRRTEDGQWTLSFPKDWEATIYATCPWVWPDLRRCRTPMLGIRGAHSDVISDKTWAGWKRLQPAAGFVEFRDAGHLVPFELPVEVARAVLDFFAGFE